jgi:hypothetical protein
MSCGNSAPGRTLWLLAAILTAIAPPANLQAQESPCIDRGGIPVAVIESDSLHFAAWATLLDSGEPVIYQNPLILAGATPAVRLLVNLHECAHHVLGHVHKLPSNDVKQEFERAADCWAIQRITEREMMSPLLLEVGLKEVSGWAGDRTHLGGEELLDNLRHCLSDKTDPRLWSRFLDDMVKVSPDSLAWIRGELIPQSEDEQVQESIIDAPGTYDCDIRGNHVLVCQLFDGVQAKPALARFRTVRDIIRRWMKSSWQSIELEQPLFHQPRVFLAWDDQTGYNLSLVLTDTHRLFFTWSAVRP